MPNTQQNPPEQALAVTGLGLVTPIGLSANQSFASFCAGISRFQETEDFYCRASDEELAKPQPLVWSRILTVDAEAGSQRVNALAIAAVNDLLQHTRLTRRDLAGAVVLPVLPEAQTLTSVIAEETGLHFHAAPEAFIGSEAGFVSALRHVRHFIYEQGLPGCILVAADSLLDSAQLNALDDAGRIKSARNLDGFIPGEGATAVYVEALARAQTRGAEIHAIVTAQGDAEEPHPPTSADASQGDGLLGALSHCAEQCADGMLPGWVVSNFNGESRLAREWGTCLSRMQAQLPLRHMWCPAESLGHTGVAAAGIGFTLAAFALGRGYAPESTALLTALGQDPRRAGLVLAQFGFA